MLRVMCCENQLMKILYHDFMNSQVESIGVCSQGVEDRELRNPHHTPPIAPLSCDIEY